MSKRGKEIIDELRTVISGRTLDALLPPMVFLVVNGGVGLNSAIAFSMTFGVLIAAVRVIKKQTWKYALVGFLGAVMASGLAYLTQDASNYFIGAALGSVTMLLLALLSLILGKPMAAWVSHLTRGWPLEWFWRKDVKPAYREVTFLWALLFAIRLWVQIVLLQRGDATQLGWASIILGWPVTLPVLIVSYVYGIWRLKRLGGPGSDEFIEGTQPPWRGQTRGF